MSDLFGTDRVAEARGILVAAVEQYKPDHIFVGLSGGHDSLCAAHLTSNGCAMTGCLHVNTGIGIRQTREFVQTTGAAFEWSLRVYEPPPGHTYREIVQQHGFPGPYAHRFMYSRLKERAIRLFLADHPGRVMLVTGARAEESRRRMGHSRPVQERGRLTWVAPLIFWTSADKRAYMATHGLPENEVVRLMCYSGECLCGAFARPNELEELRLWYPEAAAEIDELQHLARAAGKHCKWGVAPPDEPPVYDPTQATFSFCHSCDAKWGRRLTEEQGP